MRLGRQRCRSLRDDRADDPYTLNETFSKHPPLQSRVRPYRMFAAGEGVQRVVVARSPQAVEREATTKGKGAQRLFDRARPFAPRFRTVRDHVNVGLRRGQIFPIRLRPQPALALCFTTRSTVGSSISADARDGLHIIHAAVCVPPRGQASLSSTRRHCGSPAASGKAITALRFMPASHVRLKLYFP